MNIEKVEFDHFKNIEELIEHLEMWYAEDDYYAYDRYFGLRDARIMGMYIYQLQQENKQLKEELKYTVPIVEYNKMVSKKLKQNQKYKEVIDKAIEYINDNLTISSILDGKKYYTINNYSFDYRELLDMLKEVSE